jgi:hypothetical protein
MAELLPSKSKALSSIPNITTTQKKKKILCSEHSHTSLVLGVSLGGISPSHTTCLTVGDSCTVLNSLQQCTRVPVSPQPHLLFPNFPIIAGRRCCLTVAWM